MIREIATHGLARAASVRARCSVAVQHLPHARRDRRSRPARVAKRGGDGDAERRIRRAALEMSARFQCDDVLEVIHGEPDAVCDALEQVVGQQLLLEGTPEEH